jgi:hypothetical protein
MSVLARIVGSMVALAVLPHGAAALCLSTEYGGIEDHWVNKCTESVTVNWNDAGACKNWICSVTVPPKGRSSAGKFIGRVSWIECSSATRCYHSDPY